MAKRRMMSVDQAKLTTRQHKSPCCDCPFHRKAVPGWLGMQTPDEYVQLAHSDLPILCHTKLGPQCAGVAIYRANVHKKSRDKTALVLPANTTTVFATPMEFLAHHKGKKIQETQSDESA